MPGGGWDDGRAGGVTLCGGRMSCFTSETPSAANLLFSSCVHGVAAESSSGGGQSGLKVSSNLWPV